MIERMKALQLSEDQGIPVVCGECGGVLVYRGLGEYRCEECGRSEFDDYGKVRNYLEKNRGANVANISAETGVSRKSIRQMVKENRFEVIENRGGFLRCEMCGAEIRSGRFCLKCEDALHRSVEAEARNERQRKMAMTGYGEVRLGEDGSKRYTRER